MTPEEANTAAELHAAYAAGDTERVDAITRRVDTEDSERKARLARVEALAEAAVWYVRNGIAVFPLTPGGKTPATSHGFKDATTDVAQVRAWWAATPTANVGLPTGHMFDVIDIDVPDGYRSLGEIRERGALPEIHGRVITASGGTHLYIAATGDGNAAGRLPGIDYRGIGGYVVAPPSRTPEGMWMWSAPLNLEALGGST